MKRKLILAFSVFMILVQTSCIDNLLCINGNGVIETERRKTGTFNRIENSTMFDVIYRVKDTTGIVITADHNIIDNIVTESSGNTLEIRTVPRDACFNYNHTPVITVTSPVLGSAFISGSGRFLADEMKGNVVTLTLSGSGDINTDNVECNDLTVLLSGSGTISLDETGCTNADTFISGSGNILIKGVCDRINLKISGSGNIHSESFVTKTASAIISGSGNAYTHILEKLTGLISGSGNIYVKGNPVIELTVSGSGRVIKNK